MRIAIQTLGSRGDVQPYLALAVGLARRGHDVQLAAPAQFTGPVAAHGIPFAPLPGDVLALRDGPEGRLALGGGGGIVARLKLLAQARPLMRRLLEAERDAVMGFAPDIILHHPKSLASPHLAEALSCPHVVALPVPALTPTAAFPSPLLPFASLGPLNRASHVLAVWGAETAFAAAIRAWRQDRLGLPARPRAARRAATLYACSPQLVPVPSDWGADVHVTGAWFLDEPGWQPPGPLAAFLAAGEPPVYVGFGSMPGRDPQQMTATVAEALARTGRRGLLARGAGALEAARLPPHLHLLDEAPHDRLFPLVAATVHHGGAGTTAAALRAGRPSVICPFFGDQPFWARRVAALGAAPAPLDPARLSADRLAAALAATAAEPMRAAAERLGELIRREDGVAAAIRVIEAAVAGGMLPGGPA